MSTQGFDASQVKRSTWLAGGGAVVLLLSTFFSWGKVGDFGISGWDTGALGKLTLLAALVAIILVVLDFMKVDMSQLPIPVPLALLGATGLGLLFVILRFLFMPDHVSRGWALYVAIIAAVVAAYGAWLKMQEAA